MKLKTLAATLLISAPGLAQAQDLPPPRNPPGRLVDVGGWRLHLNCMGQAKAGEPTIVLEAGAGDFSVEWSLVQPRVSAFARVCSYDRAGDGWSELGPYPRTMRQVAYELHALLRNANVTGPYLLVGHSWGSWAVRTYAEKFPEDVAGVVLVEGGYDDPLRLTGNGRTVRVSELPAGQTIPEAIPSSPMKEADVPPQALQQMKAAASRLAINPNETPRNKLPPDAQAMRAWALARWQHIASASNPFENEEFALLRNQRKPGVYLLGAKPLIVVTRALSDSAGPDSEANLDERKKEHAVLAATLSTNGQHLIAEQSGHHVQIDQPDLVADVIQRVLVASVSTAKLNGN